MPTILDPFTALSKHLKVNFNKPAIDDIIFKLHYRATFILLVTSTVLVTQRQYIGEHIKCMVDKGIPDNVINTFCFFSTTFTAVQYLNESSISKGYIAHPGVGPVIDTDEVIHHAYYQWVPFVLLLQAFAFYVPHYLWRKLEGGRLQVLVSGLRYAYMPFKKDLKVKGLELISKENLQKRLDILKQEFLMRFHHTDKWARNLVLCEFLNLINLVLQVYFTNLFLGGKFMDIGSQIWNTDDWDAYLDPLDVVFPKVAKCKFHKYGPSGSLQNHDALCVMALNVIHEKIYSILWFWYVILFIFTVLGLVFRLVILIMHSRSARFNEFMFAYACPGKLDIKDITTVTNKCYFSDWLFLFFLAKNMNPYTFKNFFISLAESLKETDKEDDVESMMDGARTYNDEDVKSDVESEPLKVLLEI